MYAIVRIRGTIDLNRKVRDTLKMLRLENVNSCAIVPQNANYKGMLNLVKDWVAYGEVDKAALAEMLKKRLRLKGNKRVDGGMLKKIGIGSYGDFADGILSGKISLKAFDGVQTIFRLTPPSKGFKSIREHYPKGDLGYRGKEINELLMRMI